MHRTIAGRTAASYIQEMTCLGGGIMLTDILCAARAADGTIEGAEFEGENPEEEDFSRVKFDGVRFVRCRFVSCSFSQARFIDCSFEGCDISNCLFDKTFWNRCVFSDSKGIGADFRLAQLRSVKFERCDVSYGNFCESRWERSAVVQCCLREASLSGSRLHGLISRENDLTSVEFFRTSLAGLDLSDSITDGIALSDGAPELRGCTLSALQAVEFARFILQIIIK